MQVGKEDRCSPRGRFRAVSHLCSFSFHHVSVLQGCKHCIQGEGFLSAMCNWQNSCTYENSFFLFYKLQTCGHEKLVWVSETNCIRQPERNQAQIILLPQSCIPFNIYKRLTSCHQGHESLQYSTHHWCSDHCQCVSDHYSCKDDLGQLSLRLFYAIKYGNETLMTMHCLNHTVVTLVAQAHLFYSELASACNVWQSSTEPIVIGWEVFIGTTPGWASLITFQSSGGSVHCGRIFQRADAFE